MILVLLPATVLSAISVPSVTALTATSNRGMAISASSSVVGAAAGAATWLLVVPTSPELGVPLGYAVGVALVASIPYGLAWRMHRPAWFGETVIAIIGVALPLLLSYFGRDFIAKQLWIAIGISTILLSLWLAVRWSSVRVLVGILKRRGGRGVK